MIQCKPGQKIPLSYVVSDGVAGLVIKARIENFDGDLLSNIVLTEVNPGDHSDLSFPMPSGIEFVKVTLSPFLSGGVTPDTAHPITQEVVGSVMPIIAARLKVELGCEEQPLQSPVVVSQVSDLSLLLSFQDELQMPIDISAAASLSLGFKKVRQVAQVDAISVNTLTVGHTYAFRLWSALIEYEAQSGDAEEDVLAGLLAALVAAFQHAPVSGVIVGSGPAAVLTLTAGSTGVDLVYSAVDALLDLENEVTNVLSKSLGNGITLVVGQGSQALVQMGVADFEQLPRGDVDGRVKLSLGGQNFAFNLYAALSIEPDAV